MPFVSQVHCYILTHHSLCLQCNLYKVDEESMFHDKKEVQTFVFCGNCNTFENSVAIEGDDIMTIDINNQNSCRTKCMEDELCNAITWDDRRNKCAMKTVQPGFKRSKKNQYNSYVFCDSTTSHFRKACADVFLKEIQQHVLTSLPHRHCCFVNPPPPPIFAAPPPPPNICRVDLPRESPLLPNLHTAVFWTILNEMYQQSEA